MSNFDNRNVADKKTLVNYLCMIEINIVCLHNVVTYISITTVV